MKYWLMKSEPDTFSWEDLISTEHKSCHWNGVRNYQARNFMRDDMKVGDRVFFYHSSCAEPGIIGLAEVIKEAYPDHTAVDASSDYYDQKSSKKGVNPWVMVDVKAMVAFDVPLSLAEIRSDKALKSMLLVQPGQRLSIQPVTSAEASHILKVVKYKA